MRRLLIALCCLLPLVAGACDDASPTTVEDTRFASSLDVDLSAMTRTASGLYLRDRGVGTGATVAAGQTVSVHYTLHLPNGELLDVNQPPGAPYSFVVGAGEVIPGFDEGVRGMRVGGRRQLVVPPSLAYGNSPPPGLPVNAILVFTVDVAATR